MAAPPQPSTGRSWLFAGATIAGYVFVPWVPVKFVCLGLALWLAAKRAEDGRGRLVCAYSLAFAYASSFLLNPVSSSLLIQLGAVSSRWQTGLLQLALLIFGCAWLFVALPRMKSVLPKGIVPPVVIVVGWLLLLVLANLPAWGADIAYGGDEHYHMTSASMSRFLWQIALERPLAATLVWGWVAVAVWLWVRRPVNVEASGSAAMAWTVTALILAATLNYWFYPDSSTQDVAYHVRTLRYPATEPWFSAFLGVICYESWGEHFLFSYELLRLLPLVALFLAGMILASDWRWRDFHPGWRILALFGVATVPTLLYHGTLLYLELPLLPLLLLVLGDSRRWLLAPYPRLARCRCWWGAVLLGFMKDTGIVAAILLWVARQAVRWPLLWRHRKRLKQPALTSLIVREIMVTLSVLGPGVLYLGLRWLAGYRPYQLHLENLQHANLWIKSIAGWLQQFGFICAFAMGGAILLWRQRKRSVLFLGTTLFAGLWLFHFCEDPQWIGLARFNLLLLAPVLILAWEGFTALVNRHRKAARFSLLVLVAVNLVQNPVDVSGRRGAWGNSPERWYDFTTCFRDIKSESPRVSILLANMASPYAITFVQDRINWHVRAAQLPPEAGLTPLDDLHRVLKVAADQDWDYVIYRNEGTLRLERDSIQGAYEKVREYPAREGSLMVFRKQTVARSQ